MKKIVFLILLFIVLSFMFSVLLVREFSVVKLIECAKHLAEIQIFLFGIIGMWISLLYKDEIIKNVWEEKKRDAQLRVARLVLVSFDRCTILYRGLCISAIVLLVLSTFILVGRDAIDLCLVIFSPNKQVVIIAQYVLSFIVAGCGIVQIYILLSCLAPMAFVMKELSLAKDFARRTLALEDEEFEASQSCK